MTVEHAHLIFSMYRNTLLRLDNLPRDRANPAWKAMKRLHDHWDARWMAIPIAVIAKMRFA